MTCYWERFTFFYNSQLSRGKVEKKKQVKVTYNLDMCNTEPPTAKRYSERSKSAVS